MAAEYEETMKAKGFLPYNIVNLTPKLIQKAKDELGETDEVRSSALEQFRKCILDDKKLKCLTDDEFLIQFLRARKYNVDKALGLLMNCVNLMKSFPEVFSKLDKESMNEGAVICFTNILPFRDNDNSLVLICKMENWNPDDTKVQVLSSTITALFFYVASYHANQITGVRLLFDAAGYTFKQVRCVFPRYMSLLGKALKNSLPFRFKSIHVVNESIACKYAWSLFKFFLSKKITSRVHFHGNNIKEIHNLFPKEILPLEYDGDYTNYNDGKWLAKELDKFHDRYFRIVQSCF